MDVQPVNQYQTCELVYTSSVTFQIDRGCRYVRIGPLAYVTGPAVESQTNPQARSKASLEHRMLEGSYRVYRVKRTTHLFKDGVPRTRKTETFTVITLTEIDPIKIVAYVGRGIVANRRHLIDNGMVFREEEWMQLVGRSRTKDIIGAKDLEPGELVRRQLALTSYVCHTKGQRSLFAKDLDNSDVNTILLHPKSRELIGPIKTEVHGPEKTEFTVHREASCLPPLAIGVVLPRTDGDGGVHGCVLYTHSTRNGRNLDVGRAFAVVVGPAGLLSTSNIGTNINHPVWCGDFLFRKTIVVGRDGRPLYTILKTVNNTHEVVRVKKAKRQGSTVAMECPSKKRYTSVPLFQRASTTGRKDKLPDTDVRPKGYLQPAQPLWDYAEYHDIASDSVLEEYSPFNSDEGEIDPIDRWLRDTL